MTSPILKRSFFSRDTIFVAKRLLGAKLVRESGTERISGIVAETEAYLGPHDSAAHASKGLTPRTVTLFGIAGTAYVYFIYGMYYMLNVVAGKSGSGCAVLLRGLLPCKFSLKAGEPPLKMDGPGKLTKALHIDSTLNGWNLTLGKQLWFERYRIIPERFITAGPRIGIDYAKPQDREAPLRFRIHSEYAKTLLKMCRTGDYNEKDTQQYE